MNIGLVCSLLLCLFSALVEVHSQIIPYVSFMGTNLSNHSFVDLTQVGTAKDGSDSVQCHTDLSTCCNAAAGSDRGDWYFPNGTQLPLPKYSTSLRVVNLSELIYETEEEVMSHLVYITVLLRPMQSMMMMAGRLCMQDCMLVEVRRTNNAPLVNNIFV